MPPTPARPSPDVATMDRNPKRSQSAAMRAFRLRDQPGSARTPTGVGARALGGGLP